MVAMIPIRRCGSHALRLRLNMSKEFFAPYPLHICDFLPLVPLYGDLNVDENYLRLVTDVIGLQKALMVQWPIDLDPQVIFDSLKDDQKRSIHLIVGHLLMEEGKLMQAKVVLDKSLDAVHYADELLELHPDIVFINAVRDPRAQVSSMNNAIIHDFATLPNALAWTDAHTKARELAKKYPDRVCTTFFEDFIDNQEFVLKKICSFLKIAYVPDMRNISKNPEAAQISQLSALWENNYHDPICDNKYKFKKYLSKEEIEIIETIAGELMDFYGYEKMTPGKAVITEEMLRRAQAESNLKKAAAWEKLRENDPTDFNLRTIRKKYIETVKENLLRVPQAAAR